MAVLEPLLVTAPEKMSDAAFCKHMSLRHRESLGYLKQLYPDISPYLMRMWRVFHNHLHRWRIDLEHEHGEP